MKYSNLFENQLGLIIEQEDEMECLITGLNFLVHQIAYQVFTYDERRAEPMKFENNIHSAYPYLLVNVGSGGYNIDKYSQHHKSHRGRHVRADQRLF